MSTVLPSFLVRVAVPVVNVAPVTKVSDAEVANPLITMSDSRPPLIESVKSPVGISNEPAVINGNSNELVIVPVPPTVKPYVPS